MNKRLSLCAFLAGAATILWIAIGYRHNHPLALAMTLLIGATYLAGAIEMRRFRLASEQLAKALAAIPVELADLQTWLAKLPAQLQTPVRRRVEGERQGLPVPVLTPYLVGLLVMLGMLGTFLGMVVTLNGAVIALEGTTDLQAMRASLASPIKGLGLAFGTSVAGVAASAMLGLILTLCRRERLQVVQQLDARIAGELHRFSREQQRQQTLNVLQQQAQAVPQALERIETLIARMDQQNLQLSEHLLRQQQAFHEDVRGAYRELAGSVGLSLQNSLESAARAAGEALSPVVATTMTQVASAASELQLRTATTLEQTLQALSREVATTLEQTQRSLASADQQRLTQWQAALNDVVTTTQAEWRQIGNASAAQQQALCATLEQTAGAIASNSEQQARRLLDELGQLMQLANEAPKAATEVISQLRAELSASLARDNALLDERARLMETLNTLLDAINHGTGEQRNAIDALVAAAGTQLERAGSEFARTLQEQSARTTELAAQLGGSAAEVASLGEAFQLAVERFGSGNETLIASLQRVEAALDKSSTRSDEQLAYYVAQARELLDLSVLAQKKVLAELQQLAGRQAQHPTLNAEVC